MRQVIWTAILFTLSCGLSTGSSAQETRNWKDIDCAQVKIAAAAGLKCRSLNYAGVNSSATSSRGVFQQLNASGTVKNAKVYYHLHEMMSSGASVTTKSNLSETIRNISPQAKTASGFSELSTRNGVDFVTFTGSAGEACIGVRRFGPAATAGYKWILYATRCTPAKATVSDSDIAAFIAGTVPSS